MLSLFSAASGLNVAPIAARSAVMRAVDPAMAVGLVYSTTTGNTETVAGYIAEATGLEAVDIADLSGDDVAGFDGSLARQTCRPEKPDEDIALWPAASALAPLCVPGLASHAPMPLARRHHHWCAHVAHRRRHRALGHRLGRVRCRPAPIACACLCGQRSVALSTHHLWR